MNLPLSQRACFHRSYICKAWAYVGVVHRDVLFSSDRTSKESACCFTAEAPQGIQTSGQTGLVYLPLSVRFPPLFLAPPTPPPSFPSSWPHTSHILYLSHHSFQPPLLLYSIYPKPFCLVSGPKSLSVIYSVCVASQSACLHPE